jgi:hypothetical protein
MRASAIPDTPSTNVTIRTVPRILFMACLLFRLLTM